MTNEALDAEIRVLLPINDEHELSSGETQRLIAICVEVASLCSRIMFKFDPAAGAMIGFARDEIVTKALGLKL